jgi:hypothetical protein
MDSGGRGSDLVAPDPVVLERSCLLGRVVATGCFLSVAGPTTNVSRLSSRPLPALGVALSHPAALIPRFGCGRRSRLTSARGRLLWKVDPHLLAAFAFVHAQRSAGSGVQEFMCQTRYSSAFFAPDLIRLVARLGSC